ncbi:MAG: 5-(carboxyamino)imidazole ribonucleotide synthase [Ottowia sp.]|nr:5-(carboxyamino)imidazole ribonucleotide synthase [Ottowia sp.]
MSTAAFQPLLPGSDVTLGMLGGGQLGRMFVHAAQAMGFTTAVLDPAADSPAGLVSERHLCAAWDDAAALDEMAGIATAVSLEFENVPAAALEALQGRCRLAPGAEAVAIAQDRIREKELFARCARQASGVPPAPYMAIASEADLAAVPPTLLPGVLKAARLGYDGKGQARVRGRAELAAAWEALGRVPCVLEQMLPLAAECSIIIARGADGQCVHLPVQRNTHRDGILAISEIYEGNVPQPLAQQALAATKEIAQTLDYVGVLCVEFFILDDDTLVVNEMAPRPHNSGHYSIDACDVSQFELQVRTLAGLPLPQPRQHSAAVMLNLLGDLWFDAAGQPCTPPWAQVLALPGAHLHLYGKTEARRGRKMGHITFTGDSAPQVRAQALRAAQMLGIAPF